MSDEAGRLTQRLRDAAERSRTRMDELSQRCDATEERAEQISDAMRGGGGGGHT